MKKAVLYLIILFFLLTDAVARKGPSKEFKRKGTREKTYPQQGPALIQGHHILTQLKSDATKNELDLLEEQNLLDLLSSCNPDTDVDSWNYWKDAIKIDHAEITNSLVSIINNENRYQDKDVIMMAVHALYVLAREDKRIQHLLGGKTGQSLAIHLTDLLKRYPHHEGLHVHILGYITANIVLQPVETNLQETIDLAYQDLQRFPSLSAYRTVFMFFAGIRRAYQDTVAVPALHSGISILPSLLAESPVFNTEKDRSAIKLKEFANEFYTDITKQYELLADNSLKQDL